MSRPIGGQRARTRSSLKQPEKQENTRAKKRTIAVKHPADDGHGKGEAKAQASSWTPPLDIAVLPLPPRASGLVGRSQERQWLHDRLLEGKSAGVWAFAGMGGVGKTSLVADLLPDIAVHFPGGVAVIRANEITDPAIILRQLVEKFVPDGPELLERGALTKAALLTKLALTLSGLWARGQMVLIAIDNVERDLIPRLKQLLDYLYSSRASVVITAREELPRELINESIEIHVFPIEAAVELFRRLIFNAEQEISPAEQEDILTICRITGNHAQALVLAAADFQQRPLMTLSRYRQYLESAPYAVLKLQDQLSTDAPKGVRLTFASSYKHLPRGTQQLFVALGTLAGPSCTVSAVLALGEALGQTEQETVVHLETLLRAKLVRRSSATQALAVDRIELHPLVQRFAQELLGRWPAARVNLVLGALARHYAHWVQDKKEEVLRADDLNLLAVLEWAKAHRPATYEIIAELTCHLGPYWQSRLQLEHATTWLPLGIEAMSHLGGKWQQQQGPLAHTLAAMYYGGGRPEAKQYYLQSLDLFRKTGDRKGEALALHSLGILTMQDQAISEAYLLQSLEIRQQIQDRAGEGQSLNSLGILARENNPAQAEEYLRRSLEIRKKLGEERNIALTLRILGVLAKDRGDYTAAQEALIESLRIFRKIRFRRDEAITLQYLGVLYREIDDPLTAREYYNDALDLLRDADDRKNMIASRYGLGFVALQLRELETARQEFEEGLDLIRFVGDQRSEGVIMRGLGMLAELEGDRSQAENYYREGLALSSKVNHLENVAKLWEALGLLLCRERSARRKSEGRQLLAQAIETYRTLGKQRDAQRLEQKVSSRQQHQ